MRNSSLRRSRTGAWKKNLLQYRTVSFWLLIVLAITSVLILWNTYCFHVSFTENKEHGKAIHESYSRSELRNGTRGIDSRMNSGEASGGTSSDKGVMWLLRGSDDSESCLKRDLLENLGFGPGSDILRGVEVIPGKTLQLDVQLKDKDPSVMSLSSAPSYSHFQLCIFQKALTHFYDLNITVAPLRDPQWCQCDLFVSAHSMRPDASHWDWRKTLPSRLGSTGAQLRHNALRGSAHGRDRMAARSAACSRPPAMARCAPNSPARGGWRR